jgi:hypothetical protein
VSYDILALKEVNWLDLVRQQKEVKSFAGLTEPYFIAEVTVGICYRRKEPAERLVVEWDLLCR